MTLQEFRDLFVVEYKFEAKKRGVKFIELNDKIIASWMAEAQQDISNRVKPTKTYQDISIVVGAVDYSLNSDYGQYIRAEYAGKEIDIVSLDEIMTTSSNSAQLRVAVYWETTGYKLKIDPTQTSALTLRFWYYADTLWYSPSGSASQDWGIFDGQSFTGDFKIPGKMRMLIKYYLLAKCFNDYSMYEAKVKEMIRSKGDSRKDEMTYSLGGY